MEKIKNIISPGHRQDDEVLYGSGKPDQTADFSNKGAVSGEASHFGPSGSAGGQPDEPAPGDHVPSTVATGKPTSRAPQGFDDDGATTASVKSGTIGNQPSNIGAGGRDFGQGPASEKPTPLSGESAVEESPSLPEFKDPAAVLAAKRAAGLQTHEADHKADPPVKREGFNQVEPSTAAVSPIAQNSSSTSEARGITTSNPVHEKSHHSTAFSTREPTYNSDVVPQKSTAGSGSGLEGQDTSIGTSSGDAAHLAPGQIGTYPAGAQPPSKPHPRQAEPSSEGHGWKHSHGAHGHDFAGDPCDTRGASDEKPPNAPHSVETANRLDPKLEPAALSTAPILAPSPDHGSSATSPSVTRDQATSSSNPVQSNVADVSGAAVNKPGHPSPLPATAEQPNRQAETQTQGLNALDRNEGQDSGSARGHTVAPAPATGSANDSVSGIKDPSSKATGPAPNTAGPHKSDLLNKLDPRVDSDLSKQKNLNAAPQAGPTAATDTKETTRREGSDNKFVGATAAGTGLGAVAAHEAGKPQQPASATDRVPSQGTTLSTEGGESTAAGPSIQPTSAGTTGSKFTEGPTETEQTKSHGHGTRNAVLGAGAASAGAAAYNHHQGSPNQTMQTREDEIRQAQKAHDAQRGYDERAATGEPAVRDKGAAGSTSATTYSPQSTGVNQEAQAYEPKHDADDKRGQKAALGAAAVGGTALGAHELDERTDRQHEREHERQLNEAHKNQENQAKKQEKAAEKQAEKESKQHDKAIAAEAKKHDKEEKKHEKDEKKHSEETEEKKPGLVHRLLHPHENEKHESPERGQEREAELRDTDTGRAVYPNDPRRGKDDADPPSTAEGVDHLGSGKTTREAYQTSEGHNKLHKDPPAKMLEEHGLMHPSE